MTDQKNSADKLRKLLEAERFAMLTTCTPEGKLVSRPMTIQEVEGWTVRFIAQADNDVTLQSQRQQVNLALMGSGSYVSLSGTGGVETDIAKKRALWDRLTEAYAGDADDPRNVIIEIALDSGEYWDGGNPMERVLGLAKALATGERPDAGDHGTVRL